MRGRLAPAGYGRVTVRSRMACSRRAIRGRLSSCEKDTRSSSDMTMAISRSAVSMYRRAGALRGTKKPIDEDMMGE